MRTLYGGAARHTSLGAKGGSCGLFAPRKAPTNPASMRTVDDQNDRTCILRFQQKAAGERFGQMVLRLLLFIIAAIVSCSVIAATAALRFVTCSASLACLARPSPGTNHTTTNKQQAKQALRFACTTSVSFGSRLPVVEFWK